MRTTLTIDDDLAGLLKRRAPELGRPFKEVVNRTIRAGLGEQARPRSGTVPRRSRTLSGHCPASILTS